MGEYGLGFSVYGLGQLLVLGECVEMDIVKVKLNKMKYEQDRTCE